MAIRRCRYCDKDIYVSFGHAAGAALNASRQRGEALRVYPCPKKRGFHLTKQLKRT